MKVYVPLTVVLLLISFFNGVRSQALSLSIAGMESLIAKEKFLIDNLELYLGALEHKAEVIRSNIARMRVENEKALIEKDVYLMNPLQAFSLLRRIHSDWVYWELYMTKSIGDEFVSRVTNERHDIPTQEEFEEAADAMFRLQDTYGLNPIEMSVGKLNGVTYSARLSAIDCFSIAYYLHGIAKYEEAALWFHSAMNLYTDNDPMNEVLEFDLKKILYFYAQTFAKQDILDRAILLLNSLISNDPKDATAIRQKHLWEMESRAKENFPKTQPVKLSPSDYQKGCRGEFPRRVPNLYCAYNTTTDPFLKLAPFKMEVVSLDPYMVLYHDVISDDEIEILQQLAKPKLIRATVYNAEEKKIVGVRTRTSKFAWFPDNTNPTTERINQRLADMTGFDLQSSEQIQVMNYGLGGHYDTHFDFFNISMENPVVQQNGDRVATALFYMSDVEQGGATVFPIVGLAVFPKKGACIFWHNLNRRGEGDSNTLHAACPVLVGSKWVCNKWIREKAQIFRRPCLAT